MRAIFPVFILLLLSGVSSAKDIPNPPQNYILDEPHVLTAGAVAKIHNQLAQLDKETGRQLVVAIFNSLEGEEPADYTQRVAHAWKIGNKETNNGILLAFYWKEHKNFISVGYGLEPLLTDAKSKEILVGIRPYLRAGNPDAAVTQAVEQIIRTTNEPKHEEPKLAQTEEQSQNFLWVAVGIILVVGVMIFLRWLRLEADKKEEAEREKRHQEYRKIMQMQREKDEAREKARLKKLFPNLSYSQAVTRENEIRIAKERKQAEEEEKRRKKEEEAYLRKKYKVGIAGMTLAAALALEAKEKEKLRRKAAERKRQEEEEESQRRRRRREEKDSSSSSSYSSSSSSSYDSGSSSDSGGFSGGGGDFGGGGGGDSW